MQSLSSLPVKLSAITITFLCVATRVYGQDLRAPAQPNQIGKNEQATRLIRNANIRTADAVMIDALMDNDWKVSGYDPTVNRRYAIKPISCTLGRVETLAFSQLVYAISETNEGAVVRVSVDIGSGMPCDQGKSPEVASKFIEKLFESASYGRFFESVKIEINGQFFESLKLEITNVE